MENFDFDKVYDQYPDGTIGMQEDGTLVIDSPLGVGVGVGVNNDPAIRRLIFQDGTGIIGSGCFCNLENLEEIIFLTASPIKNNDGNIDINLMPSSFSNNPSLRRVAFPGAPIIHIEGCFNNNPSLTEIIWPHASIIGTLIELSIWDSFNGCPNLSKKYIPWEDASKLGGFDGTKPYDPAFDSLHLYEKLIYLEDIFETRKEIDPSLDRADLPSLDEWFKIQATLNEQLRQQDEQFNELFKGTSLNKWFDAMTEQYIEQIEITSMLHEAKLTLLSDDEPDDQ